MRTLADHLERYLRLRKQLGYVFHSQSFALRSFVRFAEIEGATCIRPKLVLKWLSQRKTQQATRANRWAAVRRFATYLSAIDGRTQVFSQKIVPHPVGRRAPYIYTDAEVLQIIEESKRIAPDDPLKAATQSTLIGLLAVTGMRVGEALALNHEDVNFKSGTITIRKGKGNRSRLVPLHDSSIRALRRYAELRDRHFPKPVSCSFFVNEKGMRLLHGTALRWFWFVTCRLGLRTPGDRRGPRIHDLRHYFAIRTLVHWYRSNVDVEAHLPELSTYLGHAHVRDTYWYLSATPELLKLATARLERGQKGAK